MPLAHHEGRPQRRLSFTATILTVIGALILLGGGVSIVSLTQGPRVTETYIDPQATIQGSGSRLIFTTNQALADIAPEQAHIEPAAEFTLDASGRTLGLRFTTALDAETTYTVHIDDVQGQGGGPTATLETTFTTPPATIYALHHTPDGDDQIISHTIGNSAAQVHFEAAHIDDFRITSRYLVVSTRNDVLIVDRDGTHPEDGAATVRLPGEGTVTSLQVSEHAHQFGMLFEDTRTGETSLLTGSLADAYGTPRYALTRAPIPGVTGWQFVPETSTLLAIDDNGALTLMDLETAGTEPMPVAAQNIQGIARSTYTAYVKLAEDKIFALDLATGETIDVNLGDGTVLDQITPTSRGSLRAYTSPDSTVIVAVEGDENLVTPLARLNAETTIQHLCASPSAQYTAITINQNAGTSTTRIVDTATGELLDTLPAAVTSWCETGTSTP